MAKTWVEISRGNLHKNLSIFRDLLGKEVEIAFVIKANAYGHGLKEIVEILENTKKPLIGMRLTT